MASWPRDTASRVMSGAAELNARLVRKTSSSLSSTRRTRIGLAGLLVWLSEITELMLPLSGMLLLSARCNTCGLTGRLAKRLPPVPVRSRGQFDHAEPVIAQPAHHAE